MDIVMRKGTEKKVFWDFEDGEYRAITNGLGTVYSAEEFNKLYNKSLEQKYSRTFVISRGTNSLAEYIYDIR